MGSRFFPAVTVVFRVRCLACSEDFSVVLLNYGLQVVCAAITYFYVVFVEDLVVPVVFRKMFTDEVQKLSADVSLYVHAVRRIKPNYVSLSFLAAVSCGVSCDRPGLQQQKQAVPLVRHRKTLLN